MHDCGTSVNSCRVHQREKEIKNQDIFCGGCRHVTKSSFGGTGWAKPSHMSQVLSGCSQHPPLPGCLICAAGPPNGRDAEGDLSASNVQPGNAAILITNPRRGLGQPAALTLSGYIMYIVDVSDPLPVCPSLQGCNTSTRANHQNERQIPCRRFRATSRP